MVASKPAFAIVSTAPLAEAVDSSVFRPILSNGRLTNGIGLTVSNVVRLSDGRLLAAGNFKVVNGRLRLNLVRLSNDGSLDESFAITVRTTSQTATVSSINCLVVQPDGKIIIGGNFNFINDIPSNNIARLNPDGSLDSSFLVGTGFSDIVTAVALQPDGKILVGGNFGSLNGFARTYLARLNSDGSIDAPFNPTISTFWTNPIKEIVPLSDGKIMLQGLFHQVNSVARRGLARINSDGSLDASFVEPGVYSLFNLMYSFAIRPDGKIYIGGFFEIRVNNQLVCQNLCLLNSNGTLDTSYFVSFPSNSAVRALFFESDSRLLVHGSYSMINGVSRNGTARLNEIGSVDSTFNPAFDLGGGSISWFIPSGDGGYLLPGNFSIINGSVAENMARIDQNGFAENVFRPSFSGISSDTVVSALQPDQRILVSGNFNRANGVLRERIARFNPDGSLDESFNASISNGQPNSFPSREVDKIVVQPDGKILVGGSFAEINGQVKRYLARLNPDGSTDIAFNPVITYEGSGPGTVFEIAIQSDNKILVGGRFRTVNGVNRVGYARLNADGTLDADFQIPFDSSYFPSVSAISVISDGKILIGGDFRFVGDTFTYSIARLNPNGSLDISFSPPTATTELPHRVNTIALQNDGKIVLGGNYTGGPGPRPLLARLNSDGSTDSSFVRPSIGIGFVSDAVRSVVISDHGRIIIGGTFSRINGVSCRNIVRLTPNGRLDFSVIFPNASPGVASVEQTNDSSMVVAGSFDRYVDQWVSGIVRFAFGNRTPYDYDADGRADLSVRRPSDNIWYLLRATAGYTAIEFGVAGDLMVPADYDGDGKTDVAMFRPSTGQWFIFNSATQSFSTFGWGANGDLPVPADHDGDGKADLVVFRPSTNTWYTRFANGTFSTTVFGVAGDKPVVGDFDGDGKADIAVYRPSDGNWYILKTGFGFFVQTWGVAGDTPVPADYDGDGKTDVSVWRPSTGQWFRIKSTAGFDVVNWGQAGDKPIPADYDGDGKSDVAVFRPSNATWYIVGSTSGQLIQNYGVAGDLPTQGAFIY